MPLIKTINERSREFAAGERTLDSSLSVRGFFEKIENMVADISGDLDKQARLRTATDFDTLPFLPELRNALIHLVRNTVDHGIEEPLEHNSVGKGETGIVEIKFRRMEDYMCEVLVGDDGRGIDMDSVKRKAGELGLLGENATRAQILGVLFSPKFSAKDSVSDISGRGVGLDAVHEIVEALQGTISVATKMGEGTRFILRIPS